MKLTKDTLIEGAIIKKGTDIKVMTEGVTGGVRNVGGYVVAGLDQRFKFKPLLKDITVKIDGWRDTDFKKGDLVSNIPGGLFIKNSSDDGSKFGTMIKQTDDNVEIVASALN